jgi:putative DNA primase/helicase
MEDRPWPEWRNGKPITAPQLARVLRPFGIVPLNFRRGNEVVKGYLADRFTEAWARYLPEVGGAT